jgi:predicted O-methyltransferase YrrM
MLEKIGDPNHFTVNKPQRHAIDMLNRVLQEGPEPTIAEVGVGIGATTLELCKLLNHKGRIYLFDFQEKLDELAADLMKLGFTNFVMLGNENKPYDGYGWSLAKLLLESRRENPAGLFDYVYLDGAHLFHHDAASAVILKELLKPGGILLLDDYHWMIATSPTMRPELQPEVVKQFSAEQINTPHVKLICDLFLDPDPVFEKIDLGFQERERKRAYRKLQPSGTSLPRYGR